MINDDVAAMRGKCMVRERRETDCKREQRGTQVKMCERSKNHKAKKYKLRRMRGVSAGDHGPSVTTAYKMPLLVRTIHHPCGAQRRRNVTAQVKVRQLVVKQPHNATTTGG